MTGSDFLASLHGVHEDLGAKILHVLHILSDHQGRNFRESGEPVLEHPFEVMRLLLDWSFPDDVVIAGGLHDVLEDTSLTFNDLEREFNLATAQMVWAVTKRPKNDFPNKEERLEEFRERFLWWALKIFHVIFIKFGDRLHNLHTLHGLERKDPGKVIRVATETLMFYVPLAREGAKVFVPVEYHGVLDKLGDKMELLAKSSLIVIPRPDKLVPAV